MLKTIFLDLDDTIRDFRRAERQAITRTLRRFDIPAAPAAAERYHQINRQQWELLERGELTRAQLLTRRFDLLFAELGVRRSSQDVQEVYEAELARGCFFMPGAQELLETLAPRYALYLATNGTPAVQHSRIAGAGIARCFRGIFISAEMGADKPSQAFFRACFDAIPDFDPAAALMVGDSLTSDIQGARNAGLRSCWYNPQGLAPRPDIPPDFTIRDLSELPPLLKQL